MGILIRARFFASDWSVYLRCLLGCYDVDRKAVFGLWAASESALSWLKEAASQDCLPSGK